jgi:hypothetical protein
MTEQNIKIPKHLSGAMKIFFKQAYESYYFEPHHLHLLTLACECKDRATEARKAIEKHGLTYLDKYNQIKMRPECQIERDNKILFTRLIRELNLSEEPDDHRPQALKYGGKK